MDIETEDEIVARAVDGASLEVTSQPMNVSRSFASSPPPNKSDAQTPTRQVEAEDEEDATFSFPILPTHLPNTEETDDQADAMMSRLYGLSGPSHVPGTTLPPPPKAVAKGWDLPGYDDSRDDDLESWCCGSLRFQLLLQITNREIPADEGRYMQ